MKPDDTVFEISAEAAEPVAVRIEGVEGTSVLTDADQSTKFRLYLTSPAGSEMATSDSTTVRIWIKDAKSGSSAFADTIFNGRGG